MNNIEIKKGFYGVKAIIKSGWQNSFLEFLLDKEVVELELNVGKGWQCDNIDFLESLPNLISLTIIDYGIKSIDAIHFLRKLQKLQIMTYCKNPIDFHSFPNLVECSFEWIKGSESIFEILSIKKLFINNYKGKSDEMFSELFHLEELSILNSPIENFQGISTLKNLKSLRLGNLKKITSLQGLENLGKLEILEIQKCKGVFAVSNIFKLKKLKNLLLLDLGNITSIKGIEQLSELKNFMFYESTNIIDGDISPVLSLRKLERISFQNRKHYTHKREDFGKKYA